MARDPAFLFYPGDWQGGTSTFSRFLKGCYLDVLIAQFNSGHLSLEEIRTVLGSDFGQSWPTLQKKFKKDGNGLFFNEKLDTEIVKRKEYSKSRSDNRKGKTHEKDMSNISKTYVSHMENENEDVIKNAIEIKGVQGEKRKGKLEIFEEIFTDELFVGDLSRMHPRKNLQEAFEQCWLWHTQKPSPPVEGWEWRQKLSTWLNSKQNGQGKSAHDSKSRIDEIITNRHGSG